MALSDFTGPNAIDDWSADLDRRWPEREPAFRAIVKRIATWCEGQYPRPAGVLELGIGAGHLAGAVLDAIDASPLTGALYTGLDIEDRLIDHGACRLKAGRDSARIDLKQVDLNGPDWHVDLGPVDVAFSLQSLHDLSGFEALRGAYQRLFRLLRPGGLIINADFVEPFAKDDPHRPRRFPVERHRQLLTAIGFTDFAHSRHGQLACMSAETEPTELPPI